MTKPNREDKKQQVKEHITDPLSEKSIPVIEIDKEVNGQETRPVPGAKEKSGVNRKTWKKRATKALKTRKGQAKAAVGISRNKQNRKGKDKNNKETKIRRNDKEELDKTEAKKDETEDGKDKEDSPTKKQQKNITEYFSSQETGKEIREDDKEKQHEEKSKDKSMETESERSKENKPSYLAIAQRALRSNSPYQKERKK